MPKTERFEFRTTPDFMRKLSEVSAQADLSKPEALRAGIELLEKLLEADKKGEEIRFVKKRGENA